MPADGAADAPKPSLTIIEPSIDHFEAFWAVVPKRVAKGAARKAYISALKRSDAATILAGMVRYASSRKGQDANFTAHPATWLNADRWADEAGSIPEPRQEVDRLMTWADSIRTGKDFLCRNIPSTAAREMVQRGLVTQDQCKRVGVPL